MRKKQRKIKIIITLLVLFTTLITGCKRDDMEDIEIIVTSYPNEYIIHELYGEHSTISSIYPDGVDISNYKINKKQKNDYSNKDLFIYNGLVEKERNLAIDLLDINQNLKIIDSAYVLETKYSADELWLNPSSMLMMSQNIRLGLKEYITSNYLKKQINDNYNELKIKLSELDANYRLAVENTNNKTMIVSNENLKFLEKFGIDIICITNNSSDDDIKRAKSSIQSGAINYIYSFKGEQLNDNAKSLLEQYSDLKQLELHRLDNISDSDRTNKKDYISIMNDNLELIKQELYQ